MLLVSGPDFEEKIQVSTIPGTFRRRVLIKSGQTYDLNFYTDAKKLDVPSDPRSLHLRITNFNLNRGSNSGGTTDLCSHLAPLVNRRQVKGYGIIINAGA